MLESFSDFLWLNESVMKNEQKRQKIFLNFKLKEIYFIKFEYKILNLEKTLIFFKPHSFSLSS